MIAMVSNMSVLRFRIASSTGRSATWVPYSSVPLSVAIVCCFSRCFCRSAALRKPAQLVRRLQSPQRMSIRVADTVKFLAGGALAFGAHEGGHLVFDVIFDANPRIEGVHFGPFPFFAITHAADLSPRREFTISSAGFWVQEAVERMAADRASDPARRARAARERASSRSTC